MEHALEALSAQLLGQLFVEVEASGRHVHVTKEQAMLRYWVLPGTLPRWRFPSPTQEPWG